jgi:two-component system, LytTR family, sensor kinase
MRRVPNEDSPDPSASALRTPVNPAQWWLISFALWTVLALLAVTPGHFGAIERGIIDPDQPWGWWRTLAGWLPRYEVWALLSPPIFWLATRFPIQRERALERFMLHALASATVAIAGAALHSAVICMIWPHPSYLAHVQKMLLANFSDGVVTYWIVLLAAHAYAFRRLARDRAIFAAQLDARLKSAELATIRLQLNPHFLFNALNTLAVLMREDEAAADQLLERLCLFLRAVLAGSTREETSLADELELLDHYLAVEAARYGDRLVVRREIAPETLGARVPRLVLQPLVENAIKHAVAPRTSGGTILLSAVRRGDMLELTVADDGPGWRHSPPQSAIGQGVGLANTRLRLLKLHGHHQHLELMNAPGSGGALVRLTLPHVHAHDPATG